MTTTRRVVTDPLMLINVLLVVGVLISLLSGVELFLRPHQRQQIQQFLEEITIRADDIEPAEWIARIKHPGVQAVLVMLTYFEFSLLALSVLLFQASGWKAGGTLQTAFGTEGQTVQAVAMLISFATLFFAWKWPLPQLIGWVLGGETKWSIRRRFISMIVLGCLFFGAYLAFAIWFIAGESFFGASIHQPGSWEQSVFMWSLLPVWPAFIVFWVLFQGAGLALQPRAWLTRALLLLFKATLWRIVEYNKGAASAVALIATIYLTVLKLLLS